MKTLYYTPVDHNVVMAPTKVYAIEVYQDRSGRKFVRALNQERDWFHTEEMSSR